MKKTNGKTSISKELSELLKNALIQNPHISCIQDKNFVKKLVQILEAYGNGYGQVITSRKNQDLKNWLFLKTAKLEDTKQFKYTISTRVFWILSGTIEFPKCLNHNCTKDHFGEQINISLRPLHGRIGYPLYCSKECRDSSLIVKQNRENTNLKRYGVKNTYQSEEKKELTKQTLLQRFGVDHPSKSKDIIKKTQKTKEEKAKSDPQYYKKIVDKSKATKQKKHGNPNFNNIEKIKSTNLEKRGVEFPMQDQQVLEIRRKSNMKKYGVEEFLELPFVHELSQQSFMKKYGSGSAGGQPQVIQKREETCLERYNEKSYFETNEFKEKSKQKSLDIYGTEYPSQAEEIKDKIIQTRIKNNGTSATPSKRYVFDGINFDSSWELYFWIYCKDHEYPIQRSLKIYEYYVDGKKHLYNVDFEICGQEIEIKGSHFFDKNGNMTLPYKNKSWTKERYEYECRIYNEKFKCMIQRKVLILTSDEIKTCRKYVEKKYGKDYILKFKKDYQNKKV